MKILSFMKKDDTIGLKSKSEFYGLEEVGIKKNTVRLFTESEIEVVKSMKFVQISESEKRGEIAEFFHRKISNVSVVDLQITEFLKVTVTIISWNS